MIVGISGPSGSGKTTIARALCQALRRKCPAHHVQILHQDDFYRPERDIACTATRAGPVVNWDNAQAIEMGAFIETLQSYKVHGAFPPHVRDDLAKRAKEDQNERDELSDLELSTQFDKYLPQPDQDVLIVDGLMLYSSPELLELFDVAILLRGSYRVLKERREARSGYVTLEGFWQDPEGYFQECVWPEYVASHKHFFKDGDVEGTAARHDKVIVSPELDLNLQQSFRFVIEAIRNKFR